jgi:hypothetical protein
MIVAGTAADGFGASTLAVLAVLLPHPIKTAIVPSANTLVNM